MRLNIQALTPEWHEKRRSCITATDVPAILGLSSYKSALDVWGRITGKVDPQELEDNPYLRWGRESEELNAKMFAEEAGRCYAMSGTLWSSDAMPFLLATPDAFQLKEDETDGQALRDAAAGKGEMPEGAGILELKAPSVWKKGDWEEGVPMAFQVQAVTQMVVCGLGWGSCSALLPPEVAWDDLEPGPRVTDSIITSIERFWAENVIADRPPTVIDRSADRTLEALRRLHPLDNGATIELSPAAAESAREFQAVKAELKALQTREKELKAAIQREMGDATFGVIPGTVEGFSWKHQTRHEKAREAREVELRVFRAARIKAGAV